MYRHKHRESIVKSIFSTSGKLQLIHGCGVYFTCDRYIMSLTTSQSRAQAGSNDIEVSLRFPKARHGIFELHTILFIFISKPNTRTYLFRCL